MTDSSDDQTVLDWAVFVVLFVIASAIAGPFIFGPPLWDEHRKKQLAGLSIGLVFWALLFGTIAVWLVL